MPVVVCQKWEESESEPGWGVTVRDSGFSLHLDDEDRKAFIKQYWAAMPKRTPASYDRPSGEPYFVNLRSNSKLYKKLRGTPNGLYQHEKAPEGFRKVS